MKNEKILKENGGHSFRFATPVVLIALGLLLATGVVGCSGKNSSTVPKALIQEYVSKHETMVDRSLVDLYVASEREKISQLVDQSIAAHTSAGNLGTLQHASFDFTNLETVLVDETNAYVDDSPTPFMKVSATGSFTMKLENGSKTIPVKDVLILEREGSDWKITESTNPWG